MAQADATMQMEVSDAMIDPRSGEMVTALSGGGPLPTVNRVIHWETNRGRNSEFDQTEAGTGQILLRNRDGIFDPLNAASPYTASDNLLPVRQVRITANTPAHPTVYNPIFTGYVEGWGFERSGPRNATCTLDLMDGFELLNNAEILITKNNKSGGHYFGPLHVDDRIIAALGFAGWPASRTSIFSGNVICQENNYDAGVSMLQVIQEAVESEFPGLANFYMDRSGNACFRGRGFRFDPFNTSWNTGKATAAKLWKFGDDGAIANFSGNPSYPSVGTLIPMHNLQWTFNKEHLYNVCQVIPANLDPKAFYNQVVSDSVLAKRFGKRDLTINGLLTYLANGYDWNGGPTIPQTAAQECKRFATYYLQNYKHAAVRATALEVRSKFETDLVWNFLVNVEIGDVVELYTLNPPGEPTSGGFFGDQFFVDGIHNSVDAVGKWPSWTCTLDLTPRGYFGYFPPPYPTGSMVYPSMMAEATNGNGSEPPPVIDPVTGYSYPPNTVTEDRQPTAEELKTLDDYGHMLKPPFP